MDDQFPKLSVHPAWRRQRAAFPWSKALCQMISKHGGKNQRRQHLAHKYGHPF